MLEEWTSVVASVQPCFDSKTRATYGRGALWLSLFPSEGGGLEELFAVWGRNWFWENSKLNPMDKKEKKSLSNKWPFFGIQKVTI